GPLDLLWSRRRLVRERARARLRAGRRSGKPLHPRDDPAARVFGQKLAAIGRSRRCGKAPRAAVPDLRRRPDRPAEGVAIFIGVACSPHGAQRHAGILDFASLNPGYELRAYRACPGRSAARSDALQTRDRFDLWRSRISGAPLHFVSRCTASGTRHGRELTWTRI